MPIALCGLSALEVYFRQRDIARYPRITLTNYKGTSRAELDCFLERYPFTTSDHLELVLPSKTKGRPSFTYKGPKKSYKIIYKSLQYNLYPDSFIPYKDFLVASPELCFLQIANELSPLDLLFMGYKMCGDYRPSQLRWQTGELPLTSAKRLTQFVEAHPHFSGTRKARQALTYLADNSNSHMESRLSMAFALSKLQGGYGIPTPALNQEIPNSNRKGDLCWLDHNLVVEYDSKKNHDEDDQRDNDARRRVEIELTAPGMRVITVRSNQVSNSAALDQVAQLVARQLGCDLRTRVSDYNQKKDALHEALFHQSSSIDEGCN